jgi:hypothetical protein
MQNRWVGQEGSSCGMFYILSWNPLLSHSTCKTDPPPLLPPPRRYWNAWYRVTRQYFLNTHSLSLALECPSTGDSEDSPSACRNFNHSTVFIVLVLPLKQVTDFRTDTMERQTEDFALLGCHAEEGGSWLPTFRDSICFPSFKGQAFLSGQYISHIFTGQALLDRWRWARYVAPKVSNQLPT